MSDRAGRIDAVGGARPAGRGQRDRKQQEEERG
jgi:hypothetical protein